MIMVFLYYISFSDEDEFGFAVKRQKPNNSTIGSDSDSDGDGSTQTATSTKSAPCKYTLKALPKSVVKTAEDSIPLPDPFILPKNFRPDVTAALQSGKMTHETDRAFLSAVASSMFSYKRYPTADDYINVARTIIAKYPFMKSPTGKPYVSLIISTHISYQDLLLYRVQSLKDSKVVSRSDVE